MSEFNDLARAAKFGAIDGWNNPYDDAATRMRQRRTSSGEQWTPEAIAAYEAAYAAGIERGRRCAATFASRQYAGDWGR